ncbi:MAG: lipid-binding SYLF domain-containing protein [Bryobacteraceae bacterium]
MKRIKLMVFPLITSVVFAGTEDIRRLSAAASVFSEVMSIADKAIPQELLDKAECAVIVPGLKKGAFIFGGKFGRGFLSCRKQDGAGWSAPGAIRVEGGSFGLQIGGSETDVIMLVMNRRGAERLLSSRFTLGGDASVAAGPVGRTATAQTDAFMTAEILSWSRSRGVFAGVSLQGATLREDSSTNREIYRRSITNRTIVMENVEVPAPAQELVSLLNKYSARR